jgi:D-arabinose 1-dehydrogenase-like Zn-dependent alcohol dehydrogenase
MNCAHPSYATVVYGRFQRGEKAGVGRHGGHRMAAKGLPQWRHRGVRELAITGLSTDGGYAEYMLARAESLVLMPEEFGAAEGLREGAVTVLKP